MLTLFFSVNLCQGGNDFASAALSVCLSAELVKPIPADSDYFFWRSGEFWGYLDLDHNDLEFLLKHSTIVN